MKKMYGVFRICHGLRTESVVVSHQMVPIMKFNTEEEAINHAEKRLKEHPKHEYTVLPVYKRSE